MENKSCGIIIGVAVAFVALMFIMPCVCMTAWGAIAAAFNLPTFTYWQWFFISWAIRWLFKSGSGSNIKNDN